MALEIRCMHPGEAVALGDRQGLLAEFRSFGEDYGDTILVAANDGLAVGWGAREQRDNLVSDLWVSPEWQGKGVGQALLGALEAQIADAGYGVAELETLAANAGAIRFYERQGFVIVWRREKFSSTLGYAIDKVGMNKRLGDLPGAGSTRA